MVRFTLERGNWYAWHMFPGYAGVPYFSPIYLFDFIPLKTGARRINLHFFNSFYADGVQDFDLDLEVLLRAKDHLTTNIIPDPVEIPKQTAIISHVSYEWIEEFFPEMTRDYPIERHDPRRESVSRYLSSVFTMPRND